jgi:hypothetical protein
LNEDDHCHAKKEAWHECEEYRGCAGVRSEAKQEKKEYNEREEEQALKDKELTVRVRCVVRFYLVHHAENPEAGLKMYFAHS